MAKKFVNNIDDAILKVVGSATDSKFIIKNNHHDIINKLNTIQDTKFQSFATNTFKFKNGPNSHWNRFENAKLLRLEGDRGGSIRKVVKNKLPYKDYSVLKSKTNKLAKRAGFKNEEEFITAIEGYLKRFDNNNKTVLQEPKLLQMISFIKSQVKKHPKATVTAFIASGTVIAILKKISEIHKKNSGCFRYYKKEDGKLVKQKISGNFCVSNDDMDDDFLPESEHPLFNKEKWNCDYKNFDLNGINGIKANEIFDLGCNGLCDLLNYNALAALTLDYEGITLSDEEHEKHDRYMYICERASILREFTTDILNSVDEVAKGVMQSELGNKIYEYFDLLKGYFIIIMILFFIMLVLHKFIIMNNKSAITTNNNNKSTITLNSPLSD